MTVTNEMMPASNVIVVRDKEGPLSFRGEVMVDLSWSVEEADARRHAKWTDIVLYRDTDPKSPFEYALQIIARSLLYHKVVGGCRRGVAVPVSHLAKDMVRYEFLTACPEPGCNPPELDNLQDNDLVSSEEPIYTLHRCRDADELALVLDKRSRMGAPSGINMKLKQVASQMDPAIEMAILRLRQAAE
jgi:hypothetical protein